MPHVHYYHMPNFQNSSLVQTYISHANHVLNMNEGKGNHTTSTRASIEADIIRLIHEGQFPLEYKIACTSMIMHTDAFDVLWASLKIRYNLPEECMERYLPEWDLLNSVQPVNSESCTEVESAGSPGVPNAVERVDPPVLSTPAPDSEAEAEPCTGSRESERNHLQTQDQGLQQMSKQTEITTPKKETTKGKGPAKTPRTSRKTNATSNEKNRITKPKTPSGTRGGRGKGGRGGGAVGGKNVATLLAHSVRTDDVPQIQEREEPECDINGDRRSVELNADGDFQG